MARKVDQRTDRAGEDKPDQEASDPTAGVAVEQPPEVPQKEVPAEVTELGNVVGKINDKIKWHQKRIQEDQEAIEELRAALAEKLGMLSFNGQSHEEEHDDTARQAIIDFLKTRSGRATNTEIAEFFTTQNRRSPSVELSRMVKRNELRKGGRGVYLLPK